MGEREEPRPATWVLGVRLDTLLTPGSIENSCAVTSADSGDAQRALLPSLKTPPQVWSLVKRGDA